MGWVRCTARSPGRAGFCGGTRTQFQLGRIDTALSALTVLRGPLTGLAGLAHLRSRLGEIYREAELRGTSVPATSALVVVEPLHRQGLPSVERELRLIDVAECLRIVFSGGDVLGRIGPRRAAAFVGRNPNLPDEVETVRSLITRWRLDSEEPQLVRIWIEGLPGSVE